MKRLSSTLIALFLAIACLGQADNQDKYDFDETKYTFDTPDQLVRSFIETMSAYDRKKFLEHCLSKEAALYFIEQTAKLRPDAQNIDKAIEAAETKFEEGQDQYVTAYKNLIWHIHQDSVDLTKAEITSIDYEVGDWYRLKPNVMFTAVDVTIKFKGSEYQIRLPQLIRVKDKWFIAGPEFWWQNHSMRTDITAEREQDQVQEIYEQALERNKKENK